MKVPRIAGLSRCILAGAEATYFFLAAVFLGLTAFFAVFFFVDRLAAFFLAVFFLAVFFFGDRLAAFFLAAFFLVDRLAVFFLAVFFLAAAFFFFAIPMAPQSRVPEFIERFVPLGTREGEFCEPVRSQQSRIIFIEPWSSLLVELTSLRQTCDLTQTQMTG